jgi:L-ascorbate peroxidase
MLVSLWIIVVGTVCFVEASSSDSSADTVEINIDGTTTTTTASTATGPDEVTLVAAQSMIDTILQTHNCHPIMVRLAWHDSGTYDVNLQQEPWPTAGGAIGSIRFAPEINHGANAGLSHAIRLLEPVKRAYPNMSYADIYQMASARAIALAGGPIIDMNYGRIDATTAEQCSPEGNLPDGNPHPDTGMYGNNIGTTSTADTTPNGHLRKVFYRMGLNDEEIVALSGAHTFGRAYKDRSGAGAEQTKYTDGSHTLVRHEHDSTATTTPLTYKTGGSSWTTNWLTFDNSYYHTISSTNPDPDLLQLETDKTLFDDEKFKVYAELYKQSQDAFFLAYAKAHKKLSELGSKFV